EVHGDAAAHGAGADDRDFADRLRRRRGGHVRDLVGFALGEEEIALRLRLLALEKTREKLALALQPLLERQSGRRLDRIDASLRRFEAAFALGERAAEVAEKFGVADAKLVLDVAHAAQPLVLAHHALGEGEGGSFEVA